MQAVAPTNQMRPLMLWMGWDARRSQRTAEWWQLQPAGSRPAVQRRSSPIFDWLPFPLWRSWLQQQEKKSHLRVTKYKWDRLTNPQLGGGRKSVLVSKTEVPNCTLKTVETKKGREGGPNNKSAASFGCTSPAWTSICGSRMQAQTYCLHKACHKNNIGHMHPGTEVITAKSAGNRLRNRSYSERHEPVVSNITYVWA